MTLSPAATHDPARALVPVLARMPAHGITLGDILADSGYAHRDAGAWAIPLRAAGAQLVQDLHPHDRGPQRHPRRRDHRQREPVLPRHPPAAAGTRAHCPATPPPDQITVARHPQASELARHKLGRITADDADGYHRVTCPAATGKIRCPLRPGSMTRDRNRPEILTPPEHPPACCTQQTITVPPQVAAKTRQKHDYPSPAHRRSYARRTGSERTFSTIKDTATSNIARGWCRLTGLPPLHAVAGLPAHRPQPAHPGPPGTPARPTTQRRAAAGLPPKTRRRRRTTTLASLTTGPP